MNTLKEKDQKYIWHPYTPLKYSDNIPIVRAQGSYLFAEDGKRYIDAISSWWVNLHGHAHPYIAKKVSQQLHTLEHAIFAGFTHPPAIALSERLLHILPENQSKIFFSDNGSTAVEVAIKIALQKEANAGNKKNKIIAFKNAYHGDTFGTMSVSERGVWSKPFSNQLFDVVFIDTPTEENLSLIKKEIDEIANDTACFVYEPLIQGAGGMLTYDASHLSELMRFCRERGILLIQDEVFTGFGRTGKNFAADHLSEMPDMMCLSKGLTGGTMALGATSCTQEIYGEFYGDEIAKTFYHGHSFTANPLACAAALASLDLLLEKETQKNIASLCEKNKEFAQKLAIHTKIQEIRRCGTILAVEIKTGRKNNYFDDIKTEIYGWFLSKGILTRPLGNVLYFVPPYCISLSDVDFLQQATSDFLETLD